MIIGMPRIAIAVHDFAASIDTFREKLGMPVVDVSESTVKDLGASLAMCIPEGGSNIEIMSPADPSAALSQSLQRFLDRRGEGLFALMLEAPDPDQEAEVLLDRGLNVLPLMEGAGGRDVHPNSTHGVLIRVYPIDSFAGYEGTGPTSAENKPGLSGIARVIIAVDDLDRAVDVYGTRFAMNVDMGSPSFDVERGVQTAICKPASGGVIELVSVEDSKRPFARSVRKFLDRDREGMFAVVLQSRDLQASRHALLARGVEVALSDDSTDVLEIDPGATFGMRVRIENARG
jgi:catechol 2,3-dioxygenase-like lactoylglutathione lyase family enzyme